MTTPIKSTTPCIEGILSEIYANEAQLQQYITKTLLMRGMDADQLPDNRSVRALAMLGVFNHVD
jgi:hypothetical protein